MQLLIVHRDAELGAQLVQMVKDYTTHDCDIVDSEAGALAWARRHSRCAFLLTQLEATAVDGLRIGGSLSENFPGLQTAFLPAYPRSEQRLEVEETKVFPEPIDGEALLATIARAERAATGAPDLFHVVDVLQMCCLSRCNGAVQIVTGEESGIIFLRDGQIVHAETGTARGQQALVEMVAWGFVEFAYDRTIGAPVETITTAWDTALIEAVANRTEHKQAGRMRQGVWAKLRDRAS
jgi:Domain of unknown function (DUF4388)